MAQRYYKHRHFRIKTTCFYPLFFWIKKGLNIWLVTFSFLDVLYRQSINYHDQFGIIQGNAPNSRIILGEFKSAFFQPFVIQYKTYSLPVQQLDLVPAFINKDKNITIAGITTKGILYKPGKSVKTFAHIGWVAIQVEPVI
ncbi:MAG TPA: hypothetical protein VLA03_00725 [Draconibacterium sp.]|nr:hypothetical protein [Draconibacterium sp.]